MPLLPWLWTALVAIFSSFKTWFLLFLATAVGPYIINLLIGAGVGYVTYELGSFAITEVFNDVKSSLTGLPADLLAFVAIAKLDEAVSILMGGLLLVWLWRVFHQLPHQAKNVLLR